MTSGVTPPGDLACWSHTLTPQDSTPDAPTTDVCLGSLMSQLSLLCGPELLEGRN